MIIGIYLYFIISIIRPQDWQGSLVYKWPMYDVLLPIMFVVAFLFTNKTKDFYKTPQLYLMIILLFFIFMSNYVNGNSDNGIDQSIHFIKKMVLFFIFLVVVNSEDRMKSTLGFLAIIAVLLSWQGMYQTAYGVGWASQGLHSDASFVSMEVMQRMHSYDNPRTFWIGDWDGPNVLSLIYVIAAPFCLEYMFGKTEIIKKVFFAFLFAFLCIGIRQTDSRGGFISLGFIVVLFMLMRFKGKKGLLISAMVLVVGLAVVAPSRMSDISSNEASAHERTWLWERGLNWARENPIFGIGKGTFADRARIIAHSNYVENLAELGYVGFFAFIAMVYFSAKGTFLRYLGEIRERGSMADISINRVLFVTLMGFNAATFFVTMQLDMLYVVWALCGAAVVMSGDIKKYLDYGWKDAVNILFICFIIHYAIYLIAVKEII